MMSNGLTYSALPNPVQWYVFLGDDGWICVSRQNDPGRLWEYTGEEWMDLVANEVAAKGGSVDYTVDPSDQGELPPSIVQIMIDFMSTTLKTNLKFAPDVTPPSLPDDADLTVLMRKARDGDEAWVKDLLKRKVELEAADDEGCTALMYAAHSGQFEVVKLLLHAGVNPNAQSVKGYSALTNALLAPENRTEIVRLLLSKNADPNLCTKKGKKTTLDLCHRADQRTAHILREYGGKRGTELRPWWDAPWFKWPVVVIVSSTVATLMGWWLSTLDL